MILFIMYGDRFILNSNNLGTPPSLVKGVQSFVDDRQLKISPQIN